jgi:hypothetical protein
MKSEIPVDQATRRVGAAPPARARPPRSPRTTKATASGPHRRAQSLAGVALPQNSFAPRHRRLPGVRHPGVRPTRLTVAVFPFS